MANIVKSLILNCLAAGGIPRVFHRFFASGTASILMYHGVARRPLAVKDWCFIGEAEFEKQMRYVSKWFDVLPLTELQNRMNDRQSGRPAAAITFDDGYADNCEVAWPLLKTMRLPATIFLNTALIGGDGTVWFCRINAALARAAAKEVTCEGEALPIATAEEKQAAGARIQEILKQIPRDRLNATCEGLIRELGDDPRRPIENDSPFRMLTPDRIAAMAAGGLIDFGAHTRTHTILAGLSDELLREEIEGSIDEVEGLTGRPCRTFAYPNGREGDYDGRAINILRERGIAAAVTTVAGPNDRATPPLELRRYGIGADMPWRDFLLEIHHVKNALRG